MTEKELLKIKKTLKVRAKKLHLGKKRTGAYVFGTLRKIQKNPVIFVRNKKDLENVRKQVHKGMIIESVSYTRTGYRVLLSEPRPHHKEVWGESFDEYAARAFPKVVRENPARTKTWKLGEYASGGIIQAKVNQSGNAVAIRVMDYHSKEVIEDSVFRWPLDRSNLEMYLNERTTSYYSNVILDWIAGVSKNPPLSSHGSRYKTKRTHGLSLPEMRALYKLVKQGNSQADKYARKKLEVPYSESKTQLLAVIDHHIRDLAGR